MLSDIAADSQRPTIPGARRLAVRGAIAAVIGVLLVPLALLAHTHLRRSEPSARESLAEAPRAIRLWFSERPQLAFTRVRLRAADSSDVALGPVVAIAGDSIGIMAPVLDVLPNGTYRVLWQTGGADGHPMRGSFAFSVSAAAAMAPAASAASAAGPPSASATVDSLRRDGHGLVRIERTSEEAPRLNASVAGRWVELVAMIVVVGAVVLRGIIARSGAPAGASVEPLDATVMSSIADAARRFAQGALVLALAGALARLYAEAALVLGPDHAVNARTIGTILRETTWGRGWIVGLAGIVVAAAGLAAAKRAQAGWIVAGAGALAISTAPALTGHAAAAGRVSLSIAADILHTVGAGAWLGTLLVIVLVAMPVMRAPATARPDAALGVLVQRFHAVALAGASAVLLSGVLASFLRLPSVSSLWDTAYGRTLVVKIVLVSFIVALGAFHWRGLLPRLGDDRASRTFRRTAGVELALAAVVLLVTALLAATPTPETPTPPIPATSPAGAAQP